MRSQKTGLLKLSQKLFCQLCRKKETITACLFLYRKKKNLKGGVRVVLGSPRAELSPNQCPTRVTRDPRPVTQASPVSPVSPVNRGPVKRLLNAA